MNTGTSRIKKHILSNIPYLAVMWFCLKLGTAYRLAEGGNIGLRLMDMMNTIPPALADFAPGANGMDWLVGLAGAAAIRLVVYNKVKKARNTERMWNTVRPDGEQKRT
jgi:type IV secretion system protein VirD4